MEAKKETVEAGSEATKSDFIRRADEMSDVLIDMADQKGTSRAVVLVAIEDDDKGGTDAVGGITGSSKQLLRLFKTMWHDKTIGPYMKMIGAYEMAKVALDDGRK